MEIIRLSYPLQQRDQAVRPRQVMAIGDFDGIHLGHQEVIRRALQRAKEKNVTASIMTFDPHPRVVLGQAQYTQVLTPLKEKMDFFSKLGVNHTYVVEFNSGFAQVSPERFVESILLPLEPDTVVVGFDFRFGRFAAGTPDTLCVLGHGRFAVEVVRPFHSDGQKVSSTLIREYLQTNRPEEANTLLGRRYSLSGQIVNGDVRGRTIGFPTANLQLEDTFVLPGNGVYAVKAQVDGGCYDGVMNIGVRPTFAEEQRVSLEVHLFDFDRMIYGRRMKVEFVSFIRPERKFTSVDELVGQIQADIAHCKSKLAQVR